MLRLSCQPVDTGRMYWYSLLLTLTPSKRVFLSRFVFILHRFLASAQLPRCAAFSIASPSVLAIVRQAGASSRPPVTSTGLLHSSGRILSQWSSSTLSRPPSNLYAEPAAVDQQVCVCRTIFHVGGRTGASWISILRLRTSS